MPKQVQQYRGTTAELDALTLGVGLIAVDTDLNDIRVFDGGTAGGHRVANKAQVDSDIAAGDAVVQGNLTTHEGDTANPHSVTKTQVGLSNVTDDAQLKIASNLSDLASAATARNNLGLVIGTDVQAYNANLAALASLSITSGDIVYGDASIPSSIARLAKGTDGQVLTLTSGLPAWVTPGGGAFENSLLHVREEQTSGTDGGTSSSTTVHTRVLNTIVTNQISGASLSSNQVTLPAGTYYAEGMCPSLYSNVVKALLYNTTDVGYELIGRSMHGYNPGSQADAIVDGRFTIAASKTFELRHYIQTGRATNGLGINTGMGEIEIYSDLKIWKVG